MFNYTCRFKAWCFISGEKSAELFRVYKYWLNQIETTSSKCKFIKVQCAGSAAYGSIHTAATLLHAL